MAHRYLIDSELDYIVVRYWDTVNRAEFDQVRRELEADPNFQPGMNRLWDQRDCEIELSHEDLVDLAEGWSSSNAAHGKRRLAYLVAKDLSWGFNRVFEGYRHHPDVEWRLFRDFDEAKQWLPLPDEVPDPRELLPSIPAST